MASLPSVQDGRVILIGENPFIWLSQTSTSEKTTQASVWSIIYSPKGSGHALFIKSELTDNKWKIYSDNFEMARWLQSSVQGMLNPETSSEDIEIKEAKFSHSGDTSNSWQQIIKSSDDDIIMNWEGLQEPILVQDEKVSESYRPYGVNVVMLPAKSANITINGKKAEGQIWPMDLDGSDFSTGALAFCENWREER